MKFYDKCGETHNTVIGMMSANMVNALRGKNGTSKLNKAAHRAEQEIDQFMEKINLTEFTKDEIDVLVSSMMHRLDDPIKSFLKGDLNSEIGERKFFEVMFIIIGDELKKDPARFAKSYEEIVKAFAGELVKVVGLRHKCDDTDAVG